MLELGRTWTTKLFLRVFDTTIYSRFEFTIQYFKL